MSDYFDELGHEPTDSSNGQTAQNQEPSSSTNEENIRRLRMMAALDGLEVEIDAPEASEEAISKLKEHKMTPDDEIECAICKRVSETDEIYKVLPCSHEFHAECILPWLKKTNSCPLCRFELETDDPVYELVRKYRAGRIEREFRLNNLHTSMFG